MNLIKYFNHVVIKVESFDPCYTLNILNLNKINIYNFKKIDEYHYLFITHNNNVSKLKKLFKSFKIINKIGPLDIIKNNILRISTIISLLFSLLLFYFMNNLVMDIKIKGDSSSLIEVIDIKLKEYNIEKYIVKKSNEELLKIEKEIAIDLYDKVEWIEIKNQGLNIVVNFLKRRESFNFIQSKKAIYSTKEGIIKSFEVEKGVKKVEINQYVRSGELLIDGTLIDPNENEIFIGAIGRVYAYTWYNLSVEKEYEIYDEAQIYLDLMNILNEKIDKEITGNDEYIENISVLKFKTTNKKGYLNVHYTLVEDITR